MPGDRDAAEFTVDLKGCARCGGEGHDGLIFKRLSLPFQPFDGEPIYTHWAPCPTNGEPIMMLIYNKEDGRDPKSSQ